MSRQIFNTFSISQILAKDTQGTVMSVFSNNYQKHRPSVP